MSQFSLTTKARKGIDFTTKSAWTTARRAPVKYNPNAFSADKAKTQKRQRLFDATLVEKSDFRNDMTVTAIKRDLQYSADRRLKQEAAELQRQRAARARAEYTARQLRRSEKLKLTSNLLDCNLNRRVYSYGKHHKCAHGYANNRVTRTTEGYYFSCDCADCRVEAGDPLKCSVCGTKMFSTWTNRECQCKCYKCPRCKRSHYRYVYQGQEMNLFYDKHNIEKTEIYLTLDGATTSLACTDFLPTVVDTQDKKISQKVDGEVSFAAITSKKEETPTQVIEKPEKLPSLAKPKPPKRSVLFAPVPEYVPTFKKLDGNYFQLPKAKPIVPYVPTAPQGGAISTAMDPLLSAGKAIKKKFAEFRAIALERLAELRNKIIIDALSATLKDLMHQVFDTLIYFVKVCYDYLAVLNPALLYRLWDARSNAVKFGAYLAEAFYHLSQYEDLSRQKLFRAIEMLKPRRFLATYKDHDYGVLTSLMGHHLSKSRYSEMTEAKLAAELFHIVRQLGVTGTPTRARAHMSNRKPDQVTIQFRAYSEDEDEATTSASIDARIKHPSTKVGVTKKIGNAFKRLVTKAEAGSDESILECILSVISTFPRSFGKGLTFLNDMFKKNMPLIMGIRGLHALADIGSKVVDSIMSTLYGECSSNKEWIELQINREGNPIHQLVCTYMTYLTTVSNKTAVAGADESSISDLRSRFYTELSIAENWVKDKKRLGMPWLSFKAALVRTFDTPPKAQAREQEPMCLVLSGSSGVGKSTIWPVLLAKDFVPAGTADPKKYISKLVYTWNPASEYQPGISDKKIIVFDDFMQNISEVNEALNIISLCTSAPYPINSANITGPEIKGMFAEPDAIVICTNTTANRAAEKLADPVALARRYDIEFKVLQRYDPKDPKARMMKIVSCPMYSDMDGSTVSLSTARAIYSTVYRAKRANFTKTSTLVSDLMKEELDIDLAFGNEQFAEVQNQWREHGDFMKDFNKYVVNAQDQVPDELEEAPLELEEELEDDDELNLLRVTAPQSNLVTRELLSVMMSNLLTGSLAAVTVTTAYAFSAFMVNLGKEWNNTFMTPAGPGSVITYMRKIFKSFVTCAITSVSAGLAAFAIYKLVSRTSESGTTRTAKTAQKVSTFEQSSLPDGLQTVFDQATGSVRVRSSGKLTNCVFIGGHYILLPYHLLTDYRGLLIDDGEVIELKKMTWLDNMKPFTFYKRDLIMLTGNVDAAMAAAGGFTGVSIREDVCLYQLPASVFSAEKNIIKHFWDGSYNLTNMPVRKIDYYPYTANGDHKGTLVYCDGKVTRDCIQTMRHEGDFAKVHILAESDYASRDASCGSMIIRTTVQEQPILGIHTAMRNTKSYFHFVTRSSLEKAIKNKIVVNVETGYVPSHPEAAIVDILPANSVLTPVGHIEKPLFQPTKTDLKKSMLHGLMGPATTAPAPLSHKDPRIGEEYQSHPAFWSKMFEGYGQPAEPTFPIEDVERAAQSIIEDFSVIKSKSIVPTKLLNLHECINGLPHIPNNTRMPMNTSCGYPYVQEGLKKTDLFSEVNGVLIPSARIVKDFNHALACLEDGTVPFLPYVLSLKDERLKLEKIKHPRTRIFTCGNVIGYLICRRYFYSALMQFYHADIHDTFCYPSLDRASFDWHYLSKKMTEVGFRGFDFDFRFWDRSMKHLLLYFATKVLLHAQILKAKEEAAVIEMVCSPVMLWGLVAMLGSFLPSGILITYLINCVINEMMHRMAWVAIFRRVKPIFVEMRFYKTYTRQGRGGDDTFTTVDLRVLEFYNGRTVGDYLKAHGMHVTSATKSEIIPESSDYCELSFLKNTTRYERGAFIPITDLQSLHESTYWVRLSTHNNDMLKATQDNAICSMRPLFFHGEEVFNDFRDKALSKVPQLALPTYKELSTIWNSYHRFPGSHTDFASRELQEDPFTQASNLIPIAADEGQPPIMSTNLQIIDTHTQSGLNMTALDKEQLGSAAIQSAPTPDESIAAISDEVIDNRDSGATSKTSKELVGTSVQDAPGTKAKPVKTGSQIIQSKNHRAGVYLNDINWDLERLLSKFTFVTSVPWTTADAAATKILDLSSPLDFLVTPAQKKPFDLTKFWKGTIMVKVVVKSSPFYAGCLAIGFSPFEVPPDLRRLINMGALIHKLSQEEGVEFTIPFRWNQGYVDATKDRLGRFCIFVVSPLRTGGDNPNSIDVSVYASFIESEFKLPDTIPAASYTSHKFPAVDTFPQSSGMLMLDTSPQADTNITTVTCDVNSLPSEMPTTVMCAGVGTLGEPEISHFQDSASCLVQLLKRFELLSVTDYTIPPGSVVTAKFLANDIFSAAFRGFDQSFALFRGSINLRIFLEPVTRISNRVHGMATLDVFDQGLLLADQNPNNSGYQTFNYEDIAMITIPWIQPTFVAFTPFAKEATVNNGALRLQLINDSADETKVRIRIDAAVADDFHFGCYIGGPSNSLYFRATLVPSTVIADPVHVDAVWPPPSLLNTRAQSGMLQFVQRAIETALPIAETVSALGLELDAHMMTEQNQLVQQRKRPFSANTDLAVNTERLLTLNHNGMTLPDNSCFGSSSSETDIYNLLQNTKSLVDTFEWTMADSAGTPLRDFWAGPDGHSDNFPGNIHSKIPEMFCYYTGGTRLIFDVQATEMHRGQLLLAYKPVFNDGEGPVKYAEASQTYFATLDLSSGRATLAVDLPYLSPRPQTECVRQGEPRSSKNSHGVLSVFVQNPLRATATVSSSVQVVVYKSFMPDFRLGVYGGRRRWRPEEQEPSPFKTPAPPAVPSFQRKPLIRSTLPPVRLN